MKTLSFLSLSVFLTLASCSHHNKSCSKDKEKKACCKESCNKKDKDCKDGSCAKHTGSEKKCADDLCVKKS